MKIIVDEAISFAQEVFSRFGDVELHHGRSITNSICKDADILITRSITDVNESLLENAKVKFVGTATIGTDHIDLNYLNKKGIAFSSAAGCNAAAVTEYVFTSLFYLLVKYELKIKNLTLGVVGCGNIGSRVARLAHVIGFNVLVNDPPLKRQTGDDKFLKLADVLKADIITFHVPLNMGGIDNTYHLIDEVKLKRIKDGAVIINSSRGAVIDNAALNKLIPQKKFITSLDVWENEPNLNSDLLKLVELGTPHIAGYSYEGKVNGTKMIYDSLCKFLGAENTWKPSLPKVEDNLLFADNSTPLENIINKIFSSVYKIKNDDALLRRMINLPKEKRAVYFESLRKEYKLRREFPNYIIALKETNDQLEYVLDAFRFNIKKNT